MREIGVAAEPVRPSPTLAQPEVYAGRDREPIARTDERVGIHRWRVQQPTELGSVNVNVDPQCSVPRAIISCGAAFATRTLLSTVTSPLIARTRSRLMARPKPTPQRRSSAAAVSCTNGSMIASSLFAGIPGPLS